MNKEKLSKTLGIIILLTMILSLSACGQANSKATVGVGTQVVAENKTEQIKSSGKLIIGTSADFAPYEFHKLINGKDEIIGFDISIAQEIAKDMGVKLEIKDMGFDGLLAALQSGNVDMVIAGMNPTADRKKKVDFSEIYYKSVLSIVVRADDAGKYNTIADLKGKKIGVQKSSTQEAIAKSQMKSSEIKSLGKVTDLVLELKNSKVDAIVVELPVASSYASKNKDIVLSNIELNNTEMGSSIAVKKNSGDFIKSINKTLDKLIVDKSIDKFVIEANNEVK